MALPGFATFLIVLLVLVLLALAGWVTFVHLRARRLGLPPPTLSSYNPFASLRAPYSPHPRTGGLVGWASDKIREFKYRRGRSAGGNFEGDGRALGSYNSGGTAGGGGAGRDRGGGFGALDPDEAWDARVGNEADTYAPGSYEEEREVGLHSDTRYGGAAGGRREDEEMGTFVGGGQKGLDRRYEEEMGGGVERAPSRNPFDDDAAAGGSIRALSPRPAEGGKDKGKDKGKGKEGDPDSPSERRSMFREEM